MKTSYGHLYFIENTIRNTILTKLFELYGINWVTVISRSYRNELTNKYIEDMYFHELLSFILLIPELKEVFGELSKDLFKVVPIRNKIAHCKIIEDHEIHYLISVSSRLRRLEVDL